MEATWMDWINNFHPEVWMQKLPEKQAFMSFILIK